jgi:hypothetical protein
MKVRPATNSKVVAATFAIKVVVEDAQPSILKTNSHKACSSRHPGCHDFLDPPVPPHRISQVENIFSGMQIESFVRIHFQQ